MDLSYSKVGLLTRRVLFEKHTKESNNYLHVYTFPVANCFTYNQELNTGVSIAQQYELKAIEQAEARWESNENEVIADTIKTMLVCVSFREIKHVFVEEVEYLCSKKKFLLEYIICFLIIHNVRIYTKNGLINYDYIDLRHINDKPFQYFFNLVYNRWNHPKDK